MPAPIIIEVTPQARAVISKLQRFPQDMGNAIKRGMDEAGLTSQREIAATRFSGTGKKPFPVAEHRLRNISERLRTSIIYNAAKVETGGSNVVVTGSLGSRGVWYFPLHEFGGTVTIKPFFRKNKGATTPSLTRLQTRLGVKLKGKREVVKAHSRTYPARAPMRHGIEDHKILFQTKIQQQLQAEWAKKQ